MNNSSEKIIFKKFLDKNPNRIFEDGKRFNTDNKKNNDPLISIITVVKNKSNIFKRQLIVLKIKNIVILNS